MDESDTVGAIIFSMCQVGESDTEDPQGIMREGEKEGAADYWRDYWRDYRRDYGGIIGVYRGLSGFVGGVIGHGERPHLHLFGRQDLRHEHAHVAEAGAKI